MTIPYQTIGHFIVECSELEAFIYLALKKLADVPEDRLEILVGKPRTVDLIDIMRALALRKVRGNRSDALMEALDAAAFVFEIRQVVAHRVPHYAHWDSRFSFTDTYRSRRGRYKFPYECTEEQLRNCIAYSGCVSAALHAVIRDKSGQHLAAALETLRDKRGLPRTLNQDERDALQRHQRRLQELLS